MKKVDVKLKQRLLKNYWLTRLIASDPGRKRLSQAGKATISLISSVFTVTLILNLIGQPPLLPSVIAGMAGMMGIMVVMDDTIAKKKITTLLLGVSGMGGVTLGSLLAWNATLVSGLMLLIIFSAFYFSRFGSRYFSLGMIGFFTVYLSSFLQLSPNQFPWFYFGIAVGITYAFLYNFIIFKDSVQLLRRSMRSFHIQANLTFQLFIEVLQDPVLNESRWKKLEYNVIKLREYASNVSTDLTAQDIKGIWPGLTTSQLRLYVFDTSMLVVTLSDTLRKLKKDDAFEVDKLRAILMWVVSSLRDAEVLAQDYKEENLIEAKKATQALRDMIDDLFKQRSTQPEGWLYLVRRVESIATHVTKGGQAIQQALHHYEAEDKTVEEEATDEEDSEDQAEEKGLKPTTRKAIQSLIAGAIAVVVGHLISPIQPYWVLLTTFIVQLGTESVGRTYLKGFQRSVGTVIGAVIGFILAKLVSGHSEIEVVLLFIVIFLAFYLFTVSYTAMSLFITMLVAFMYDLMLGGISFELLGARVMDTIAGAAIAFGVSAAIFPTKTMDKVSEGFADYLSELDSYVTRYIQSFYEPINVKELANHAFEMEGQVQIIRDESRPILQRRGAFRHSQLHRLITIFTAVNYYAKHLVASSYQKNFTYPDEVKETFHSMEEKFSHNIETLTTMINKNDHSGTLYDLKEERETIERLSLGDHKEQSDLVHHLHYIWRINQSILILGDELGVNE